LKDSSKSHLGKERRKIGCYRAQDSVVPICWAVIQTDSKDPLSQRVTQLPLKWATATRAEEARGEEYMLRETNLQKVAFSTTHEFP